jgi:hypothetical protein
MRLIYESDEGVFVNNIPTNELVDFDVVDGFSSDGLIDKYKKTEIKLDLQGQDWWQSMPSYLRATLTSEEYHSIVRHIRDFKINKLYDD